MRRSCYHCGDPYEIETFDENKPHNHLCLDCIRELQEEKLSIKEGYCCKDPDCIHEDHRWNERICFKCKADCGQCEKKEDG